MSTTAIKERGIIMHARSVRAILEGRKTQTRRLCRLDDVNESPKDWVLMNVGPLDVYAKARYRGRFGAYFHSETITPSSHRVCPVVCPYGQPGDRLWVREAWCDQPRIGNALVQYKADHGDTGSKLFRWRSPLHMPRSLSRLTLEIVDIRVQRLHRITDADVIAEGVERIQIDKYRPFLDPRDVHATAFSEGWAATNGADSWKRNDWVWALTFRVLANK